jgi:hypothetical protein
MSQNTIITNDGYVIITDFVLVIALQAENYKVLERKEGKQGIYMYTFKREESLMKLIRVYEAGEMLIEPNRIFLTMAVHHIEFHGGGTHDD